MKLTGASMTGKTIVLGCCLGILFSEEYVLWDFGVVIKKSEKIAGSSQNFVKKEQSNTKINAVISDPFIPPVKSTHPSLLPNHIAYQQQDFNFELNPEMKLNKVFLLTGKKYLQKNYRSVIVILKQVDLTQLPDNERHDLEYWLADAFYQTGEYSKAQEIATSALEKNENDRLCLLLAMIYESQGNHKKAKKQYLKLATQYPNSDYISSARIKFRILGQP
jgi:tetratricopeptide (TPR) repeat protein